MLQAKAWKLVAGFHDRRRTPKRGLLGTSVQPSCLRPLVKLLPETLFCSCCCAVLGFALATCAREVFSVRPQGVRHTD